MFDTGAEAVADADVVITSLPNGAIVKACYAEVLPAAQGRCPVHRHFDHLGRRRPRRSTRRRPSEVSHNSMRRCPAASRARPRARWRSWSAARTMPWNARVRCWSRWRARSFTAAARATARAAKLCNNMVLAVQQIAVGEAFVLAEKLGLSAQSLFDVITGATGNCWAVHTNCPVPGPVPTSPANNDFKPGFATALMNKDLGLAMDAVNSTGSTAPLGSHAAEIYAKFAADHADKDFSASHRTATKVAIAASAHWIATAGTPQRR